MKNLNYSSMDLWELTARHAVAREHKYLPTCRLIEAAIMKLPHNEQILTSRLNYYTPIGEEVLELFGK